MFPFDLYVIICSISPLFSVSCFWRKHSLNNKTICGKRSLLSSSLILSSPPLSWRFTVGSRTILIDTHGNYSGWRQQTVVVQGQHKTINHNSCACPLERSRSRSTKKQFCQHVFAHLSSSSTGLFWAVVTEFSFPVVIKQGLFLKCMSQKPLF